MSHRLAAAGQGTSGPGAVGTEKRFGASFVSKGEPGTGLVITVFGDAVDRGLVALESITVSSGSADVEATPREYVGADGARIARAEFPDLQFGEASQDPQRGPLEALLGGPRLRVQVRARVLEVGEETVHVRATTMASDSSTAEEAISIHTFPAGRRPLRFAAAHPQEDRQHNALRALGGTDTRFALLVLDEDDDVAIPLVRELFSGWVDACEELGEGPGKLDCQLWYPGCVTKSKSLVESAFPERRGWKSVLASLPNLHRFDARRASEIVGPPPSLGGPPRPPTYGFALQRDEHESILGDDVVLPHVVLWDQGGQRDARDRLTELVRSVAGRCELVQAVVTRTERPPTLGVNTWTAYEEVCGVRGMFGQSWTTRWLRWCAERTWIGASLVQHLDDEKLAELEPFVVRRDGDVLELYAEDVDALERALAPILPSASDQENDA